MDFYETVDQVVELLRSRGRVSYRALRLRFDLDDEQLGALKEELLYAHPQHLREDGPGLVWAPRPSEAEPAQAISGPTVATGPDAERRQLTVLFCDLVDSTPLSSRLDPEDLREVVMAYQRTCAKVIARYDGHIANYLGDGLLVYFGFPHAHEDDAQRAVRAGLGIVEAMSQLNAQLSHERGVSLAVRMGCHTGPVVVDELGGRARHEEQAFGETLNIAARLEGVAAPNTLVIGPLTHQLLGGLFACEPLGTPTLKGVAQPLEVFRVLYESTARTRLEAIGTEGLTPMVGRESEAELLRELWARAEAGQGQAVLITGEAGIGKSRLVQLVTEHAAQGQAWLTPCHCSPYYQQTALYPLIDLFEQVVLRFERQESPEQKLSKLEGMLVQSGQPLGETVPLFASMLSIPVDEAKYVPLALSPEQQRQRTMGALLAILLDRAAHQPVLFVMEDLHWVDPSTLELIGMVMEHLPDARILALFTARPEFDPPWAQHRLVTSLTLNRLPPSEAALMTAGVTHGKPLPDEVVAQVVAKTDGIPLFVEELTKMLVESHLLEEREHRYVLTGPLPPLAIPNTLHDSLMARLDRLAEMKSLAQLAATLGREFSFPLLQAVSPWDEATVRQGLEQLVAAGFLYRQQMATQESYRFKHALIEDTAYQSLLRSTRQRHHRRISEVLEARFPETVSAHPELLAHHLTKGGLTSKAVPYWQTAGQKALQRSASREAAGHVERGLEVLRRLPGTRENAQRELTLQIMLGAALGATHGQQATGEVYARACELARDVGSIADLFPALWGFWYSHIARGEMPRARALAIEFLELAEQNQDAVVLATGHRMVANTAWWQGDFAHALAHCREGQAFYDPEQNRATAIRYGQDSGVVCGWIEALTLWMVGCPDRALQVMEDTVARARALEHPFSIAQALNFSAHLHQLRREPRAALARAEEALMLCTEQGFDAYGTWCLLPRGWAVAEQGDPEGGIAFIRTSLSARRTTGAGAALPWFLALLAGAVAKVGHTTDGLEALDEALDRVEHNHERLYEPEVHRLRGELLLCRSPSDVLGAEQSFKKAMAVSEQLEARSWQLRAATSLGRLWHAQGKRAQARELVESVYSQFTEGFETPDLREARALLALP